MALMDFVITNSGNYLNQRSLGWATPETHGQAYVYWRQAISNHHAESSMINSLRPSDKYIRQ